MTIKIIAPIDSQDTSLVYDANGNVIGIITQNGKVSGIIPAYPTLADVPPGTKGIITLLDGSVYLANGTYTAPIGSPYSNFAPVSQVAAIGDSITAGSTGTNSFYNIFIYSNAGRYYDCGNFGVGGQTSAQILARVGVVIASGAKTVFTQFGTNDIGQSVPEATLRANTIAIWNAFIQSGIQVIDISLLPNNTSANVPRFVQHNLWRALYCKLNGIRHLDVWPLLATASGSYVSGMTIEGTHPTSPAATLISNALYTFIQTNQYCSPILAPTDTATDSGCYFGNAVSFANTAGVPTGWTVVGSGATNTVNAADSGGFGSWARTTLTGSSNNGLHPNNGSRSALGWNIGDKIFTGCRYRWVDSNQALANSIQYNSPTIVEGQPLYLNTGGATGADYIVQDIGHIAVGSGDNLDLRFQANGTGYFEINRPIVVNMTAMGL